MKSRKLIIFGTGDIAQLAHFYFESDSNYSVVAFTVDKEYCNAEIFEEKPLVPFESIDSKFTPSECDMFIAVSYKHMNRLRADKYNAAKSRGYKMASYISSHATYLSQFQPGDNAFILEDNTIQPFVKIGDNVTLWSGNHIGHHSEIENHNFVSSQVVISGHCKIGSFCFLGVNSTLAHHVTLAPGTLLGAGVTMSKNSEENGVYVSARPTKLEKSSNEFNL